MISEISHTASTIMSVSATTTRRSLIVGPTNVRSAVPTRLFTQFYHHSHKHVLSPQRTVSHHRARKHRPASRLSTAAQKPIAQEQRQDTTMVIIEHWKRLSQSRVRIRRWIVNGQCSSSSMIPPLYTSSPWSVLRFGFQDMTCHTLSDLNTQLRTRFLYASAYL